MEQAPATAEQIARACAEVRERFGAVLPDGFADFLTRSSDADRDGAVIYGASQSEEAPGPGGF